MDSETRGVDFDALSKAFEVEPLNYEVAWKNLRDLVEKAGAIEHVPTLAPESLYIHEDFKLFNLRTTEKCWFKDEPGMPIPSYLEDNIARMHSLTNYERSGNCKALCRMILDQILISAIYEESNKETMEAQEDQDLRTRLVHLSVSRTEIPEDPAKLELLHKTPLSKTVIHRGERRLLSGFAGYGLFYDSSNSKSLPTNFVIVEAKVQCCPDLELPKLAAYMGIIHTTRKENPNQDCVIYGMASDGNLFGSAGSTITAYLLKVNPSNGALSTTPIKDPTQRKLVISAFGNPNHPNMVGFESSEINVFVVDEEDEWMYDIIGKD